MLQSPTGQALQGRGKRSEARLGRQNLPADRNGAILSPHIHSFVKLSSSLNTSPPRFPSRCWSRALFASHFPRHSQLLELAHTARRRYQWSTRQPVRSYTSVSYRWFRRSSRLTAPTQDLTGVRVTMRKNGVFSASHFQARGAWNRGAARGQKIKYMQGCGV